MDAAAFARQLVQDGLLRPEQAQRAVEVHAAGATRLDTVLLHLGVIPEEALLAALGRFLRTRTVDTAELEDVPREVLRLLPPRVARRYEVVPFRLDGRTLHLASQRPGDLLIEDEVGLLTGLRVSSFAALELRLYEALERYYEAVLPPALVALGRQLRRGEPAPPPRPAPPPPRPKPTVARPSPPARAEAPPPDGPTRPAQPGEVELSTEDLAQFPSLSVLAGRTPSAPEPPPEAPRVDETRPARPLTPEDRLADAAVALQSAEMREDVADALLGFSEAFFRRRLMLIVRRDQVVGWRGEGEGVDTEMARAIQIPLGEPSVFTGLVQGQGFWLGPLPRMPRNQDLVMGLGGSSPAGCVIVPITLRSKTIAFLYGDNLGDPVSGAPVAHLRRLAGKAGLAFEIYILKSKLRMV